MKYKYAVLLSILLYITVFLSLPVRAATVISSTRVIYPAKEREVTVQVSNQGRGPVLLQTWIDRGNIDDLPDTIKVPFVLTPPVNRLDPGKSQSIRIRYTGSELPKDRESLLWFNSLEIPPKAKERTESNLLQMAFRSRIKLFFRPENLPGTPEEAARNLRWQQRGNQVIAMNDSPWHISLVEIETRSQGKTFMTEADTVSPYSTRAFTTAPGQVGNVIKWYSVNDYGAIREYTGQ